MRRAYRKVVFYLPTDADVTAALSMSGFQQPAALTPLETQVALGLSQVALGLCGATTTKQFPVGVLRSADGGLAVVFPSEPRTVVAEIAPPVKIPVLIMPAGRN